MRAGVRDARRPTWGKGGYVHPFEAPRGKTLDEGKLAQSFPPRPSQGSRNFVLPRSLHYFLGLLGKSGIGIYFLCIPVYT